ncbi:Formyltransferase/hydrolase complex subunit D [Planctomycetes bacterium MalM25]|nr:Formyltransferase/hydrolase complex subunit D [Planctomycetes bacterium MalM25]
MKPADSSFDTSAHAEAFAARYARLIVTAADTHWLTAVSQALCGYGSSVIGCDAEIAVERPLAPSETPDGRAGVAVLAFAFRGAALGRAVANRVGQTVLTCPTAAVFDGLPEASDRAPLGDYLRCFGDGHERQAADRWTLPIMEGEVSFPATIGLGRGVAGGNLLFCGRDQPTALAPAQRAAESLRELPGIITPFPGGVCRSGSKVGSRYRKLIASTNEAYCPTLQDSVASKLPKGTACVYELIINGVDEAAVRTAMRTALAVARDYDLLTVTAADYGGRLGGVRIPLSELLS